MSFRDKPPSAGAEPAGPRFLLKRLREIMAATADPQVRLDHLVTAIAANMVADVCSIYLRRRGDVLELFATEGLNPEAVHETRLSWGEGVVGVVAARGQPMNLAEAPLHPAFVYRPETGEDPLRAFLGVPVVRNGQVLGVLTVQNRAVRVYTEEETEALQTVATVLAEVASSGELLEPETTIEVDEVLHKPLQLQGQGVVAGVAFGVAALHEPHLPKHKIFAANVGEEAERLEAALDALRKSIDDLVARHSGLAGAPLDVLEVFRLFAYDKGWKERLREAVYSGLTAEAAVERVLADNRRRLEGARDPYMRDRLHDLEDLSRRMLRHLAGDAVAARGETPENAILFARTMGPADLLEYERDRLSGVALAEGAAASHVAIVARALEIPLVAGLGEAIDGVEEGDPVVIDGDAGEIHVRPSGELSASYESAVALQSAREAAFAALAGEAARTTDGVEIVLDMNAGLLVDLPHLEETGARGVGLFRTELQFLVSEALPKVSAQTRLYKSVFDAVSDRPVVFRTADIGGDKMLPYMATGREPNPAMGWRGVRMALDRPGLMRGQMRALIAAAAGRDLKILVPLITLPEEMDAARAMLEKEWTRAEKFGHPMPKSVAMGAMIETPAAAWSVAEIAGCADFLSVGGNDLAQFFFACDRETTQLAGRFDILRPSFLGFLKRLVGEAARAATPISFCGEAANDPAVALGLIGVGFRSFSLPATAIGPVKEALRAVAAAACEKAALSTDPRGELDALAAEGVRRR
ncbi:MAG: phosphoenolpyruvate--protein phosphotransferase [Pseudomonadota bacterium]